MLENEWWVMKTVECECMHMVGLENSEINTQNNRELVEKGQK